MKPRISRLFYVMLLVALFALCLLFLAMNKRKAEVELGQCTNQMAVLAAATTRWKSAHNGNYPSDLSFIKAEGQPSLLVCPSDKSNPLLQAAEWPKTNFQALSSYELLAPFSVVSNGPTNTALFRCKIHFATVYADGHTSREGGEKR